MPSRVPLFRVAKHMIAVPVTVNGGHSSRFILDTGTGVNLIVKDRASRFGVVPTGQTHTGRRMSGQSVTCEMATLPSLRLGDLERLEVPVTPFDMGFPPDLADVDGILSLGFFEGVPLTLDYPGGEVLLQETAPAGETTVPLRLVREGPSVAAYLRMVLPSGRRVEVEVDSGTDGLILHSKFMEELGVDPRSPGTLRREGKDETGFSYTRFFSTVRGEVQVEGAASIHQRDPGVMFQDIIYDGLGALLSENQ